VTPAQMAVDVEIADDDDVAAAVADALDAAAVTLEELRNQARVSHFRSERARMAWFVISPFIDHDA